MEFLGERTAGNVDLRSRVGQHCCYWNGYGTPCDHPGPRDALLEMLIAAPQNPAALTRRFVPAQLVLINHKPR